MSLPHQGQLMRDTPESAAEIWSTAVSNLPSGSMKFTLNAATDTLPHNSNLALWRKSEGFPSNCKLCGKTQTLLHVLNDCPVALELRRYNHRHDAVLEVLAELVKSHLSPRQEMVTDLPEACYHYPQQIGVTDLCPDVVFWQDEPKEVTLVEFTVCFETGFKAAKERKSQKYIELLEEAERKGYKGNIRTIEVGSRGILNIEGLESLKSLLKVGKEWKKFL